MPPRYLKGTIAYDGTDFCGWQVQASGRSIQGVLEGAWQRLTSEQIRITASGRTDAGVHATGQVISFATASELSLPTMHRALNAHLPEDLRMLSIETAKRGFHAIRDAKGKRYCYRIQDGGIPDVLQRRYCWFVPKRLDERAMAAAAETLEGQHDFRAFQASGSQRKSTVRNLHMLRVTRGKTLLKITTEADGYLYNMVRNLVGSLVEVGRGSQNVSWLQSVLESCDRRRAGPTAPAHGLCLERVDYES